MPKVVINEIGDGIHLTRKGLEYLGINIDRTTSIIIPEDLGYATRNQLRSSEELLELVEDSKGLVDNRFCKLKLMEIPDDIEYYVDYNSGHEMIREVHNYWY